MGIPGDHVNRVETYHTLGLNDDSSYFKDALEHLLDKTQHGGFPTPSVRCAETFSSPTIAMSSSSTTMGQPLRWAAKL